MAQATISQEGCFTKDTITKLNSNFSELYAGGTGETFVSPTITGTVLGGATYNSPTFVTPTLGVALATSINGNIFTVGSSTYTGTAAQTYTFPTTSATIARTDAANTFTGVQTMTSAALTTPVLSGTITGTYTLGGTPTLASAAGVPYVGGVAAGYKLARSAAVLSVTGTSDIDTGLASVLSASISASTDLDGDTFAGVSVLITGGAGHILAKCWKNNADGDATMVAANAAKNIHWQAIGT